MHVACRHGLVNLVHALLEAGSNANIQTSFAAGEDHTVTRQTPLHVAVEAGHKDIVKVFLEFKGTFVQCILFWPSVHQSVLCALRVAPCPAINATAAFCEGFLGLFWKLAFKHLYVFTVIGVLN